MGRAKRIWYLSPMRAAKVQASLRIRAVSPEPSLLAHTSSESRGTFRQKTRSLAPLNGWACAVKMCHDGMLEDTNSLVAAQISLTLNRWYINTRIRCFVIDLCSLCDILRGIKAHRSFCTRGIKAVIGIVDSQQIRFITSLIGQSALVKD